MEPNMSAKMIELNAQKISTLAVAQDEHILLLVVDEDEECRRRCCCR